ncbi:tetratricopeptide repeat protein [bacterium]|nr:tetratricopeptide repeat protein [bacterium]
MKIYKLSMISAAVAMTLVFSAAFSNLAADSPRNLVSKGNESFRKGDYKGAVGYYEKASVKEPESSVILFNTGDVLYRKGDFKGAAEYFEKTASKTRELALEARAWYNMGNCAFRDGQRQTDSDLKKALEQYKESVRLYGTALGRDSTLTDAALNMEVARLVIKDILDRIKQQEEKMKQQQEKMREIVDSLVSLADRQDKALQESKKLSAEKSKGVSGWKDGTGKLGKKQEEIKRGTSDVKDKLKEMFDKKIPPPVQQAQAHIDSSLTGQGNAAERISDFEPENAVVGQKESSEQLKKAIASLTENKDNQKQKKKDQNKGNKQKNKDNKQQEQPKKQAEKASEKKENETAEKIISEEKKNREKREQQAGSGYRSVEKDW